MRTRTVREGSVGLLLLLGMGLFFGLILWLRNLTFGDRSYTAVIEFPRVNGMQEGAAVRYRGVTVGSITEIIPKSNGVEVYAEIRSADLIIPRDVRIEANQSGLVSQVGIDITPQEELPPGVKVAGPLAPTCNPDLIVCDDAHLQGQIGISIDELIRYSTRFADVYSNPEIYNNLNTAVKNTSIAAAQTAQLTRELTSLSRTTQKQLNNISAEVIELSNTTSQTATQLGETAEKFSSTAVEANRLVSNLNNLVTTNRSSLVSTLNNLSQTSKELRTTVSSLSPAINSINQGELVKNLETLTTNAAQASVNLRNISDTLNTPTNLLLLQQTLDSARVTFQNAQKISSDLDDLTGDPAFRENLRELVNGLSSLVSSTQQLQQQMEVAQSLDSVNTTVKLPQNKSQSSDLNNQFLIDKLKNQTQISDSNNQALTRDSILEKLAVSSPIKQGDKKMGRSGDGE